MGEIECVKIKPSFGESCGQLLQVAVCRNSLRSLAQNASGAFVNSAGLRDTPQRLRTSGRCPSRKTGGSGLISGATRPSREASFLRLRTSMCNFATGQTDSIHPIGDFCSCRTVSGKHRVPIQQRRLAPAPKSENLKRESAALASLHFQTLELCVVASVIDLQFRWDYQGLRLDVHFSFC